MGLRYNDGLNGMKIQVPTVEAGEVSAADLKIGRVGPARFKRGGEKMFVGQLLLTALKNGAVLVDTGLASHVPVVVDSQ